MDTVLKDIVLHFVGNKTIDHQLILAENELAIDEELSEWIRSSLFERFNNANEAFAFTHNDSLDYNEVYNYVKNIFTGKQTLYESSLKIAEELYQQTNHPQIKDGELYVASVSNCVIDQTYVDAIVIFKTETKNHFLEITNDGNDFEMLLKQGIDFKKVEKGCLIYNIEEEEGYQVRIFDNQSRSNDAIYWKDDFLGLKPLANEYQHTNNFLGITKEFITQQIEQDFEVSKTDKIDLLNKSVNYFKNNEEFSKEEFEQEVFNDEEVIESFREFDSDYRQTHEIEVEDNFEISTPAVKKQARAFKSVLKLDKNFHIYIHGDRDKIEKGVETDGRKFYKVYFDEEK